MDRQRNTYTYYDVHRYLYLVRGEYQQITGSSVFRRSTYDIGATYLWDGGTTRFIQGATQLKRCILAVLSNDDWLFSLRKFDGAPGSWECNGFLSSSRVIQ